LICILSLSWVGCVLFALGRVLSLILREWGILGLILREGGILSLILREWGILGLILRESGVLSLILREWGVLSLSLILWEWGVARWLVLLGRILNSQVTRSRLIDAGSVCQSWLVITDIRRCINWKTRVS
jgi:hypothetical protein